MIVSIERADGQPLRWVFQGGCSVKRFVQLWGAVVVAMVVFGGCSKSEPPAEPKPVSKWAVGKYEVGQVWTYRTRVGEEASRVTVVAITPTVEGDIVSAHVEGLKIKSPGYPGGFRRDLGHVPFTVDAMDRSVLEVVDKVTALPDFQLGYGLWKRQFDKGEAGVYELTIAETIAGTEAAINHPRLPSPQSDGGQE